MNPVDWLKALYETFGTSYPRASMVLVILLGGTFSGLVWHFAARQVEKDHRMLSAPSNTGPASTTGQQSPAITGSGNQVTYGESPTEKKEKPKK
jgi:hypothetical protein